jgi:hypothetical protein
VECVSSALAARHTCRLGSCLLGAVAVDCSRGTCAAINCTRCFQESACGENVIPGHDASALDHRPYKALARTTRACCQCQLVLLQSDRPHSLPNKTGAVWRVRSIGSRDLIDRTRHRRSLRPDTPNRLLASGKRHGGLLPATQQRAVAKCSVGKRQRVASQRTDTAAIPKRQGHAFPCRPCVGIAHAYRHDGTSYTSEARLGGVQYRSRRVHGQKHHSHCELARRRSHDARCTL